MEENPVFNTHNKQEYPPMHTAEHILNQTMIRMFDCGRSFSAHIERKKSKCDYHMAEAPTEAQIREIEERVNAVIAADLPVWSELSTQQAVADQFDLGRLPEGASEALRIVHVGDYDACPCLGAHVEHTGEIGRFSIISSDFSEGRLRLRFKLSEAASAQ